MSTSATQWLEAFAARLGVAPPSEAERERILALAGVAAHASERTAAPVACWLVASAGVGVEEACRIAEQIAATDDTPLPPAT